MKRLILSITLLFAAFALNAQGAKGPVTSDKELFDALNLDYPGMEAVKSDVTAGNLDAAKKDFAAYLRKKPNTNIKGESLKYNKENVEKYASDLLLSCGVWYQFGENIDWTINPTPLKYNEWTWQLSRHPFWAEMGRAYRQTGDEKYAKAFVRQMRSWVISNPLPSKVRNKPGSTWRTIESGIRTSGSWPRSFEYFLNSPSFDDESLILMVKSFYEHGLYLRKFNTRNNWLTMEMNGLFHIGLFFPEFKQAREWADFASAKLYGEIQKQFYPDGAQVELSTGYHWVSVKNMMGIYKYARVCGYELPADYVKGLEKAFEYFGRICMPGGKVPALNDAGWGTVKAAMKEAYDCFPDRTDFLYLASGGKKGSVPGILSNWMPWAGWYMMRSSWDKDGYYAHFEVGPYGAGHQHEDKLSFILYAYGRKLLTECGTYAYDKSQWRKYVLSARGHNSVSVDGMEQHRNGLKKMHSVTHSEKPLQNRWITNDKFEFGEGWYNEGYGPDNDSTVTHYRAVAFVKRGYWVVVDVLTPSDGKPHSYDSWFHFDAPEYRMLPKFNGVASDVPGKANLAIIPLSRTKSALEVVCARENPTVQGWVPVDNATKVYKCRPVATPVFHDSASGQFVKAYLFVPVREGEELPVRKVKQSGNSFVISFTDGSMDKLSYTVKGNSIDKFSVQ